MVQAGDAKLLFVVKLHVFENVGVVKQVIAELQEEPLGQGALDIGTTYQQYCVLEFKPVINVEVAGALIVPIKLVGGFVLPK
jgi:hypothetical protein